MSFFWCTWYNVSYWKNRCILISSKEKKINHKFRSYTGNSIYRKFQIKITKAIIKISHLFLHNTDFYCCCFNIIYKTSIWSLSLLGKDLSSNGSSLVRVKLIKPMINNFVCRWIFFIYTEKITVYRNYDLNLTHCNTTLSTVHSSCLP